MSRFRDTRLVSVKKKIAQSSLKPVKIGCLAFKRNLSKYEMGKFEKEKDTV